MTSPTPIPVLVYAGFALVGVLLALCCAGALIPGACSSTSPAPAGVECAF